MQKKSILVLVLLLVSLAFASCTAAPQQVAAPAAATKTPKPTFTPTLEATAEPLVMATPTADPGAVSPTDSPAATSAPETRPTFTATQPVNIRSGPGTNYSLLGQLGTGQVFDVTGLNPARDWLQFTFNGQPAWVRTDLVSASGLEAAGIADNIPEPPSAAVAPTARPVVQPRPQVQPTAAPAAPPPPAAPPAPAYPFQLVTGSATCAPNAAQSYFNGQVKYRNGSLRNGVCVHIAFYGPRQTKCSGCGGVGDGNWGFSPFGSGTGVGTDVEIFVVECTAGMDQGGQDENTGFGNLTPKSDKFTYRISEGTQCTGITFVGD